MKIKTLFEDDYLKIIEKPAKILVIPAPNKKNDLTSLLNEELKRKAVSFRLHPCHRLDYSTSGLIIYAKGKSMQKKMMQLFKEKKIKKTYIAFVQGTLKRDKGLIKVPLENKPALTEYEIIERKKDFSVVKVNPLTGRKNQIRLHFKKIGHPIVGEDKFAFRKDFKLKAKRLCLHAKEISFIHPITQEPIKIESELPLDMKNFLEKNN
jgi:23S rRNA pseudouridine1911/1915/1917 synthase